MGRPRKPVKNILSDKDKEKLWNEYGNLVAYFAKRYIYRCQILEIRDLIQEGYFGLIRARELFNKKLGVEFPYYASWWIENFIRKAIEEQDVQPRIPCYVYRDKADYRDAKEKLKTELGHKATIKEIAQEIGVSLERAKRTKKLIENPSQKLSIDSLKNEENPRKELLMGQEKEKPWTPELESQDMLNSLLRKHLNQEEITIIQLKYLEEYRDFTDKEIGIILGKRKERIRQIRAKALGKLRQALKV